MNTIYNLKPRNALTFESMDYKHIQTDEQKILLRNFAELMCVLNKNIRIDINEEDMAIVMNVHIKSNPYSHIYRYEIKMYRNILPGKNSHIVILPYIPSLHLFLPPGYSVQFFNDEPSIIYTKKVVNILLGFYTYEQLIEYLQTNSCDTLLLPELWSIVYSYTIGPC